METKLSGGGFRSYEVAERAGQIALTDSLAAFAEKVNER
jgi:hypothetical protein